MVKQLFSFTYCFLCKITYDYFKKLQMVPQKLFAMILSSNRNEQFCFIKLD